MSSTNSHDKSSGSADVERSSDPVKEAYEVAASWAMQRFRTFPIAIGWDEAKGKTNKRPLTPNGHADGTSDPEQLAKLLGEHRHKARDGEVVRFGYIPGSGDAVLIDADVTNGDGKLMADSVGAEGGFCVDTASDGDHRLFRKPDPALRYTNAVPEQWAGLVDVRGDHGWAVVPGTVTPWGSWTPREEFPGAEHLPVLPNIVHDQLDTYYTDLTAAETETGKERASSNGAPRKDGPATSRRSGTRSGGRWHRYRPEQHDDQLHPATSVAHGLLVERYGVDPALSVVEQMEGGELYLKVTRPGKDAGVSATVGYIAPGVVKVFSSGWVDPPLPEGVYDVDDLSGADGSPDAEEATDRNARRSQYEPLYAKVKPVLAAVDDAIELDPELRLLEVRAQDGNRSARESLAFVKREMRAELDAQRRIAKQYGSEEYVGPLSIYEAGERYADVAGVQLVERVVPAVGTGTVFGPSGEGKTSVAIHMAVCGAVGRDFFGLRIPEPFGTYFVGFEDGHELHLKITATAEYLGADLDVVAERVKVGPEPRLTVMSDISVEEFIRRDVVPTRDAMSRAGVRLGMVWFDTQRKTHAGYSVNDDTATSMVTALLRRLANSFKLNAAVITHTPIADGGRQAGSQEQKGDRSFQLRVSGSVVWMDKARNMKDSFLVGTYDVISWEVRGSQVKSAKGTSWGVVSEVDAHNTDRAKEIHEKVSADVEKDERTRLAILRLTEQAPEDKQGKLLDGWSDTGIAHAMRDLATKGPEDSRVDVHHHRRYVSPLLDQMGEQGLLVNREDTPRNGRPNLWMRTPAGKQYRAERTGGPVQGQSD